MRFQVGTASGALLSDQAAAALLAPVCRVQVTLDGVSKGCVRYDAAANKFQVDVKTTKSITTGEHTITVVITAGDGSVGRVTDAAPAGPHDARIVDRLTPPGRIRSAPDRSRSTLSPTSTRWRSTRRSWRSPGRRRRFAASSSVRS